MQNVWQRHQWFFVTLGLLAGVVVVVWQSASVGAVPLPSECSDPLSGWACHSDTITTAQTWGPNKVHVIVGPLTINAGGKVTVTAPTVYVKRYQSGSNWVIGGITVNSGGQLIANAGTTFVSFEDVSNPQPTNPIHRWLGIKTTEDGYIELTNASIRGATAAVTFEKQTTSRVVGGEFSYNTVGVLFSLGSGVRSTFYRTIWATLSNVHIHDNQTHGLLINETYWGYRSTLTATITNNLIENHPNGDGVHVAFTDPNAERRVEGTTFSGNVIRNNLNGFFIEEAARAERAADIPIVNNIFQGNARLAMQIHPAQTLGLNLIQNNGPTAGVSVIRIMGADMNYRTDVPKNYIWPNLSVGTNDQVVYTVGGTINLRSGPTYNNALHSLTIEPGVIVKFNGNAQFAVTGGTGTTGGQLIIDASQDNPVVMTYFADSSVGGNTSWAETVPNIAQTWQGVFLGSMYDYPSTVASRIRGAIIQRATVGVTVNNSFFIPSYHSIADSIIRNNTSHGIVLEAGAYKNANGVLQGAIGESGAGNIIEGNGGCGIYGVTYVGPTRVGELRTPMIDNMIQANAGDGVCIVNGTINGHGIIIFTFTGNTTRNNGGDGFDVVNNAWSTNKTVVTITGTGNDIRNNGGVGLRVNNSVVSLTGGAIAGNNASGSPSIQVQAISSSSQYPIDVRSNTWESVAGPYDTQDTGMETKNTCGNAATATVTDGGNAAPTGYIRYTPWADLPLTVPVAEVTRIDTATHFPAFNISVTPTIVVRDPGTAIDATAWEIRRVDTGATVWQSPAVYCQNRFTITVSPALQEATTYEVRARFQNRLGQGSWSNWTRFTTVGANIEAARIVSIDGQDPNDVDLNACSTTAPTDFTETPNLVRVVNFPPRLVGSEIGQPATWHFWEIINWQPNTLLAEWEEGSQTETIDPTGVDTGFLDEDHWYAVQYQVSGVPDSLYCYFQKSDAPPRLPWLKTTNGDIYAGGGFSLTSPNLVNPLQFSENYYNAPYCILTAPGGGQSLSANPTFSSCQASLTAPLALPNGNNYTAPLGRLDLAGAIARARDRGQYQLVDPPCDFSGTVALGGRVLECDGDATIGSATPLTIAMGSSNSSGAGLLIVHGNLTIAGDATYQSSGPLAALSALPSLGVVVDGNVYIAPAVRTLVGAYVVRGTVTTCWPTSGACGNVPLTIRGLLAAHQFDFGRTFTSPPEEQVEEPAERVIYDGRVLLNTPPGFSDIVKALPKWQL